MSIAVDRFESRGTFPTYDPHAVGGVGVAVYLVQCPGCSYEPPDPLDPPHACPRCFGGSWERLVRPGSVLDDAIRQ